MEMGKAAYVFALFGSPTGNELTPSQSRAAASLLTSIAILRRHNSAFPSVAMLSADWFANKVLADGLEKLHAKPLLVANGTMGTPKCTGEGVRWETMSLTFNILAIWSLEQFQVVLYLDTDIAVVHSLDHVLLYMLRNPTVTEMRSPAGCAEHAQDPAASQPVKDCVKKYVCYNTGVWAVRPHRHTFNALVPYPNLGHCPCATGSKRQQSTFGVSTPAESGVRVLLLAGPNASIQTGKGCPAPATT
jgi:hypothetical protein